MTDASYNSLMRKLRELRSLSDATDMTKYEFIVNVTSAFEWLLDRAITSLKKKF